MNRTFSFLFFLFFSLSPLFCVERIISPLPGKFANKQTLVIEMSEGTECFYSYSNPDPLASGFAYDGPVLLDATGSVDLFVAIVKDGISNIYEIRYIVEEKCNFQDLTPEKNFVDLISSRQIITLDSSNPLSIPDSLSYSIGNSNAPFLSGKTLSVSSENNLSRYIPCTVTDGRNYWRFVIHISGKESSFFEESSVPFEIDDWTKIHFTDENAFWGIDGEEISDWRSLTETFEVDRSTDHILSWTFGDDSSVVQSFVLPAKPFVKVDDEKSLVRFLIEGDSRYKMALSGSNNGAFRQVVFDTVDGDSISSAAVFEIYCDGVYQGKLSAEYELDKCPPGLPEFIAGEEGMFVRSDVELSIASEDGADVFYAVSSPVIVKNGSYSSELESVDAGVFSVYDGQKISLPADSSGAVFYKVCAYARDKAGNTSGISEYKVIIDEYNYFIDEKSTASSPDGSKERPFSTFAQAVDVINKGKFSHFYVNGSLTLSDEEYLILSNCSFTALNDAHLIFGEKSSVKARNSSLEFSGFIIEKRSEKDGMFASDFFSFDDCAVSFNGCEVLFRAGSSGTVILAEASSVSLSDSGLTVIGDRFACAFSSRESEISIKNAHVCAIAPSAMVFSCDGGLIDVKASECKVIASLGRIIEAYGVNLRMSDNVFSGEISGKNGNDAIKKDSKSLVIEDFNNKIIGFYEK